MTDDEEDFTATAARHGGSGALARFIPVGRRRMWLVVR
jgi:hypothetical protein